MYQKYLSMNENEECPTVDSTIISILGRGKPSFKDDLFKSWMSVHILIWLSGFTNMKMFKIQGE